MITLLAITLLVVGAKGTFDRCMPTRWFVWSVPILAYTLVAFTLNTSEVFIRMVLLCSTLMIGMKWVVYAGWRRDQGERFTWVQWLSFCLLWFGMNPAEWVQNQKKLEWSNHFFSGLFCLIVGLLAVTLMAYWRVDNLQLLFVAMSLGFHYGVLSLHTAGWRWLGKPVRPLFKNPLHMRGFADFWGKRWNLAYSQMMVRTVLRPLCNFIPIRWARFIVFLISGLLHELAITVPAGAGYGMPTVFFLLQGGLTLTESRLGKIKAILCTISLLASLPLLFPDKFVDGVIIPARDFFNFNIICL